MNALTTVTQYFSFPIPKRRIVNTKVAKIKPNLVKIRVYKKSVVIAKTVLPHFTPFHKSTKNFVSLLPKMVLMRRTTESAPRIKLDQKKRNPDPGEEKVPTPNSVAIIPTKIEIANQNNPPIKWRRFIVKKNEPLILFILNVWV